MRTWAEMQQHVEDYKRRNAPEVLLKQAEVRLEREQARLGY